jgi:hypothetical protein
VPIEESKQTCNHHHQKSSRLVPSRLSFSFFFKYRRYLSLISSRTTSQTVVCLFSLLPLPPPPHSLPPVVVVIMMTTTHALSGVAESLRVFLLPAPSAPHDDSLSGKKKTQPDWCGAKTCCCFSLHLASVTRERNEHKKRKPRKVEGEGVAKRMRNEDYPPARHRCDRGWLCSRACCYTSMCFSSAILEHFFFSFCFSSELTQCVHDTTHTCRLFFPIHTRLRQHVICAS